MRTIIQILSPLHVLLVPTFLMAGLFLLYRTMFRDDRPAGLVLYMGMVMLVDAYMQTGLFIPGFEQGSIKLSEILWLLMYLKDRKRLVSIDRTLRKKITILVSCYVLLFFVAALRSESQIQGIFIFRGLILPQLLAFCLAVRGFDKRQDYKRFFAYLSIVLLFLTIFHVLLVFADTLILDSATFHSGPFQGNLEERRYGSTFGNPNHLGVFIALLFPIYLTFLLSEKEYRKVFFFNILNLLFLLSQTRSRGPMLATVAAIGLMFFLRPAQLKKLAGYLLLGSIVFGLAMPGILSQLTRRIRSEGVGREFSQQEVGQISRLTLWQTTLRMVPDHPLGIGLDPDTFMKMMMNPKYSRGLAAGDHRLRLNNPHNSILDITIKAGVQTLIVFVVILFLFFRETINSYTRNRDDILFGISIGLFAYLVAINSEPVMFRPQVANLFWIVIGLGISLIDQNRNGIKRIDSDDTEGIEKT